MLPPLPEIDTPREPVTTTYHGHAVTEDYRWLEEDSPRTREWTAAQDARTRAYLDSIPFREAVRTRCEEILKAEGAAYLEPCRGGASYFALKTEPPRQQPVLVTRPGLGEAAAERVLVDPNAIDESGATTIDWYVPSPDGSLVAVSLSSHGTEDGTLHLYETDTGELTDTLIPQVNSGTAGGSLAWRHDSKAFWYTRHPARGTVPDEDLGFNQEVWLHELGQQPDEDRRDLAGVFAENRITESFLSSSPDGRWVMDRAQKGDGGEWQIFLRRQDGEGGWTQVAGLQDRCICASFGGEALFLLSIRDAIRGKVLRLVPGAGTAAEEADVVVPEGTIPIENIAATDTRVWVAYIDGGPSRLRAFDHEGRPLPETPLPELCAVNPILPLGSDGVIWALETFVSPRQWWTCNDAGEQPERTALDTVTAVEFRDIVVERTFATSRDGTRIPIDLLAPAGVPTDGSAPAILYGYGGYGIPMRPSFQPSRLLWLEHGGVFAVAGIRGGGEYGEEWHDAGRLANKQNCFDDLIACADHLVQTGVCSRARLGLMGGSNGGLLVGTVLTQRPEVAGAVVCAVPVLDMLRSETTPNGAFNVTESGTVRDPEMFVLLRGYSPYHNVRDGAAYPAVLFTAGEFDPRVEAFHAKKMTARLQAATSSDRPILLRMESGGHGIGQPLDQTIALVTDYFTFFRDRLGVGAGD